MASITLKELAEKLGVSPSTISRVLNNKTYSASPQLKEKILKAVSEYGYTPNSSAKELRTSATKTEQTFTVSCVFARSTSKDNNAFFESLAQQVKIAILNQGMKLGYTVYVDEINRLGDDFFNQTKGHGLIVLGRFASNETEFLKNYKRNIVGITVNRWDTPYDQVIVEGSSSAKIALDYLTSLGHHRIAYMGECYKEQRYNAYIKYIEDNALHADASLTFNCQMTETSAYEKGLAIADTLVNKASAVMCGNDITALGLLKALKQKGYEVPRNISVIAIDDIEQSQDSTPPLTTVHIPKREMCQFAVRLLKSRMTKQHSLPVQLILPATLTIRESVRKV